MFNLLLVLSSLALAQDVEWSETEKAAEEAEKPESAASVEFGGSYTAGNSWFFTVYGNATGSYKWGKNKVGVDAKATVGQSKVDEDGDGILDDSERDEPFKPSAERYSAGLRYDRFLSDRDSLYLLVGGYSDQFAGYDLRTHEQLGYSRLIVDQERSIGQGDDAVALKTTVVGEIGIDWAQENFVEGVDPQTDQIIAGRAMVGLTHQITETTSFTDTIEVYENVQDLEDVRVLNEAALSTTFTDKISFKISHSLLFDNVPVTGRRKLDSTTLVTLVASIL
jgi:putative salt-induced outer membrane protein YdiY